MPAALRSPITVRHFGDGFGTTEPLERELEFEFEQR